MATSRPKRHVQREIFWHGGKRRGAGRKPKGTRARTTHQRRKELNTQHPLHIVLRVRPEIGNLRRPALYQAIRDSSIVAAIRGRIRIIHISVQATHIHMLVEAENKLALARGMQGFQISAARNIHTALGADKLHRRRGPVFADRFHVVVISSPTQARNVLSYVLSNWRKHREDRTKQSRAWLIDPFSSAIAFPDWQEREGHDCMWKIPAGHDPLVVYRPRTWLLKKGWKLAGPISVHDVPSRPFS